MYSHSKIYKLQCNDGYFYIGSTCNKLRVRLSQHKIKSNTYNDRKIYSHINSIGWDNVRIILIEEFECNNKDELRQKEDEYIQKEINNELCLNSYCAYKTVEQTKEYRKNWQKQDHCKEYRKKWQKEKYSTDDNYREKSKQQKITYYEKNKDIMKQKMKDYYQRNKQQKNNLKVNINDVEGIEKGTSRTTF